MRENGVLSAGSVSSAPPKQAFRLTGSAGRHATRRHPFHSALHSPSHTAVRAAVAARARFGSKGVG